MADDNNNANKRTTPRAVLTTEVKLEFPTLGGFIEAYSDNISEGGMFIQSETIYPVGTELVISIKLQNNRTLIHTKATVAWIRPATTQNKMAGMGVEFTDLDAHSRKVIENVVGLNHGVSDKPAVDLNKNVDLPPKNLAPDPPDASPEGIDHASYAEDIFKIASGEHPQQQTQRQTPPVAPKTVPPAPPKAPRVVAPPPPPPPEAAQSESPTKAEAPTPSKARQGVVIGIDLGTTNSCVAFVQDGVPSVIPSSLGYMTTPSMVALSSKNKILVGQLAYDQIVTNPTNTIYGSKRLIGRPFNSPIVQQMKNYFTYEVVEGEGHQAAVKLGESVLSLPEISAYILREIREVAQGTLDCEINDAVVSVPAYYNDNQRNAVKRAGELAGLNVLRIVNEPTAAAMAYGFNRQLKQRVLVFDLGGGTFDVSVLEISGNLFRVIATGGDTFLGGADFDRRIIFEVLRRFKEQHAVDFSNDKVALQRVKNAAEKAKKDLSFQDQVVLTLPYITRKNGVPVDLVMQLTRAELETLTGDLVRRTLEITSKVLDSKKLKAEEIDEVLLVGGQTRMPLVRKLVQSYFGKEPRKGVHPDEVVALGAALLADSLKRESLVKLKDVLSMPIGIAIPGGRFKVVIDRNTALPYRKDYKLSSLDGSQKKFEIDIYQGESDKIIENEYLGTFTFDFADLPSKPGGKYQLAMTFSLDDECLLTVIATDQLSGKSYQSTMITKDTPTSLRDAVKEEMKKHKESERGGWLPDFAKKIIGRGA